MGCKYKDNVTINNKPYQIVNSLACKETKDVYKLWSNEDRKTYILKILYGEDKGELQNTIDFQELKKDFFVNILNVHIENSQVFLLMKYYEKGSLVSATIQEQEKLNTIKKMLEIVCYLHENNYIHGDIKPDNFFIDNQDQIVLGDMESMHQLKNLYTNSIPYTLGTKCYKYNNRGIYTLKDELLAIIATVYYIFEKELLISKDEYAYIFSDEFTGDTFEHINRYITEKVNLMQNNKAKELLLYSIKQIESSEFSSCDMLKKLNEITTIKKEKTKTVKPKKDNNKKVKKDKKKSKDNKDNFKNYSIVTLITVTMIIVAIYIINSDILKDKKKKIPNKPMPILNSNTKKNERRTNIECSYAAFVDDDIIRITNSFGQIFIYKLNENGEIHKIDDITQIYFHKNGKLKDSKGHKISCKDGKLIIK